MENGALKFHPATVSFAEIDIDNEVSNTEQFYHTKGFPYPTKWKAGTHSLVFDPTCIFACVHNLDTCLYHNNPQVTDEQLI